LARGRGNLLEVLLAGSPGQWVGAGYRERNGRTMKAKPKYRMISWVAEKYQVHPQTLRLWEREGLLQPTRSRGNTRLYDEETCERLETVITLTRDLGVNLAGVDIILNLKNQIKRLQQENEMLTKLIRRTVQKHGEVPRYHSLVKVESTTMQVVEEE
jgi:MerR family transcriptional regulator/heat shock protein HspR